MWCELEVTCPACQRRLEVGVDVEVDSVRLVNGDQAPTMAPPQSCGQYVPRFPDIAHLRRMGRLEAEDGALQGWTNGKLLLVRPPHEPELDDSVGVLKGGSLVPNLVAGLDAAEWCRPWLCTQEAVLVVSETGPALGLVPRRDLDVLLHHGTRLVWQRLGELLILVARDNDLALVGAVTPYIHDRDKANFELDAMLAGLPEAEQARVRAELEQEWGGV